MPARYSTPAGSSGSPVSVNDVATFQPGDHLQVWRGYYYHHGIYISDDRVIQFGSGVTLLNKHGTSVGEVSLKDFENGGTVKVVRHGYESWFSGYHPVRYNG
jgi:hypothetical protein